MGGILDKFYKSPNVHKLTNKCKSLGFTLLLVKLLSIGSPANANTNKLTDSNLAKIELEKDNNSASVDGNLGYAPLLTDLLSMSSHAEANNKVTDNNLENIEQRDSTDIIGNIERDTGIKFPASYRERFYDFVCNNSTMKNKHVRKYTEDFIKDKLLENCGINKSNQFLLICYAVHKQITKKPLFNSTEDNNSEISEDYKKVVMKVAVHRGKEYRNGITEYLESNSANAIQRANNAEQRANDAEQRANDAEQRANDAEQKANKAKEEVIKSISVTLGEIKDFYYKTIPDTNRLKERQEDVKETITLCKKYGVDYKTVLPPEICKFYGID